MRDSFGNLQSLAIVVHVSVRKLLFIRLTIYLLQKLLQEALQLIYAK